MPISEEVKNRKHELAEELKQRRQREYALAKSAYIWSQGLFIFALLCSAAAVAIGFFWPRISPMVVSGIAALPPLIAFIAIQLKLEARSSWHYRTADGMGEFLSHVTYGLPEMPTVTDVYAIATARDQFLKEMQREWDTSITVNWGVMMKQPPVTADPNTRGAAKPAGKWRS